MSERDDRIRDQAHALLDALRKMVVAHDDRDPQSGDPLCMDCTDGMTLRYLESRICAYHNAKRVIAKADPPDLPASIVIEGLQNMANERAK
jgi:hypothetical protein